jgi:AcrR family transcriptional regulator
MNSGATTGTLRERQTQQVRETVLEAAIAELEARPLDALSMADVARAAGVSLRTLYRYFPDRAALLEAAGERLFASLGVPVAIAGPDDIAASFREAARRLSARPRLARILVQTQAGKQARSGVRSHRVEAIRAAVEPLTAKLAPDEADRAVAALSHLCSAAAWVAVADESGLPEAQAQEAVAWAIEALVETLERKTEGSPP